MEKNSTISNYCEFKVRVSHFLALKIVNSFTLEVVTNDSVFTASIFTSGAFEGMIIFFHDVISEAGERKLAKGEDTQRDM